MSQLASTLRPDWVSDDMYPFESRFFTDSSGHRMHFVDEGEGEPVVFIHGNPAWSFEFRYQIRELRSEFRCIAPDHIGFGLSSRSERSEDHHPQSHAQRFADLLDHLGLRDITLFMTDWGGPIGLDFARRHPDRVKRLVISNTWCWPVSDDFHFRSFSFLMSSRIGRYLIRHHNIFVNKVMPAFADKPALLLWGFKDIAFRKKELERWKSVLTNFELQEFEDCGHFLAEEAPGRVVSSLRVFLGST